MTADYRGVDLFTRSQLDAGYGFFCSGSRMTAIGCYRGSNQSPLVAGSWRMGALHSPRPACIIESIPVESQT